MKPKPTEWIEPLAVSVNTAVAMTDLGRDYLYDVMARGELPYLMIGSSRRIMVADLEAWLRSHQVASPKAGERS